MEKWKRPLGDGCDIDISFDVTSCFVFFLLVFDKHEYSVYPKYLFSEIDVNERSQCFRVKTVNFLCQIMGNIFFIRLKGDILGVSLEFFDSLRMI